MSDLDRLKNLIGRLRDLEERSPERGDRSHHGIEFTVERVRREVSEIAIELQDQLPESDRLAC